ncbi:hypothetical protein [Desulfonatronum lacustre]|uniref:hypothetical protein n=1 Tax=Desulfonatronum lacustre TaxID=66849 RepID=UPI00146FA233|nr:hypothetical protein [Desulfonatronum lacustre]
MPSGVEPWNSSGIFSENKKIDDSMLIPCLRLHGNRTAKNPFPSKQTTPKTEPIHQKPGKAAFQNVFDAIKPYRCSVLHFKQHSVFVPASRVFRASDVPLQARFSRAWRHERRSPSNLCVVTETQP